DSIEAELILFIPKLWHRPGQAAELERHQPNTELINQILYILKSSCLIEPQEIPAWIGKHSMQIDGEEIENLKECMSMFNGILWLPKKKMLQHTPEFFCVNGADYSFYPEGAEHPTGYPKKFLAYLKGLWPAEKESIDCVQEIFGICTTDENKYHKGFL